MTNWTIPPEEVALAVAFSLAVPSQPLAWLRLKAEAHREGRDQPDTLRGWTRHLLAGVAGHRDADALLTAEKSRTAAFSAAAARAEAEGPDFLALCLAPPAAPPPAVRGEAPRLRHRGRRAPDELPEQIIEVQGKWSLRCLCGALVRWEGTPWDMPGCPMCKRPATEVDMAELDARARGVEIEPAIPISMEELTKLHEGDRTDAAQKARAIAGRNGASPPDAAGGED